jgi:hypothetical protein
MSTGRIDLLLEKNWPKLVKHIDFDFFYKKKQMKINKKKFMNFGYDESLILLFENEEIRSSTLQNLQLFETGTLLQQTSHYVNLFYFDKI